MSTFRETPVPLTRVYMDEEGVEWQVSEMDAADVPASRGERCLVFRSSQVIRRVWNYPDSWADLDGRALVQVSWNR